MNFLKETIENIQSTGVNAASLTIIAPSQRAAYMIRKIWTEGTMVPVMLPAIYTLDQWIFSLSRTKICHRMEWIFHCHQVLHKAELFKNSLPEFLPLGKILSYDFEELILHRVKPELLYGVLSKRAQIDAKYGDYLTTEQIQYLKQFISGFEAGKSLEIKSKFEKLYSFMPDLFGKIDDTLQKSGKATLAMAYQKVANEYKPDDARFLNSKIYWIAPRYIYPVIRPMIDSLKEAGVLTMVRYEPAFGPDSPVSFLKSPFENEAEGQKRLETSDYRYHQPTEPKIFYAGANGNIGQAKMVADILDYIFKQEANAKVQLIVPEQQLLAACRDNIPTSVPSCSSFSFHFSESLLSDWLKTILYALEYIKPQESQKRLPIRIFMRLVNHPAHASHQEFQKIRAMFQSHGKWLKRSTIDLEAFFSPEQPNEVFQLLFSLSTTIKLDVLLELTNFYRNTLLPILRQEHPVLYQRELEMCDTCEESLKSLLPFFTDTYSTQILRQRLDMLLFDASVQTEGNFDAQLQAGGVESALGIQSDCLIIAGLNFGSIPEKVSQQSYIPANIRKAFGLPTPEALAAWQAFHFFNAIYSAETVYLLYGEGSTGEAKREQSPFFWQLMYLTEAGKKASRIHFTIPTVRNVEEEIVIQKSDEVMAEIVSYFKNKGSGIMSISPSGVNTYLNCSLKFYFEYVKNLKERDYFPQPLRENEIGTAFHRAVELLYQPYIGKIINNDKISLLYSRVKEVVDQSFKENFMNDEHDQDSTILQKGLMLIYQHVLQHWVEKLLSIDEQNTPFKLLGLEFKDLKLAVPLDNGETLFLTGIIDRLMEKINIESKKTELWVVDYKTGSKDNIKTRFQSIDTLFDGNAKNNYPMQGMLYTLLANTDERFSMYNSFNTCIFALKAPVEEQDKFIIYRESDKDSNKQTFKLLEDKLRATLNEIFNPTVPFTQTNDKKICSSCAFNRMCRKV